MGLQRNPSTFSLYRGSGGALCDSCCAVSEDDPKEIVNPGGSGACCPGFDAFQTPRFFTAIVAGVADCPYHDTDCSLVNGTYKLELSNAWPSGCIGHSPGGICEWVYTDGVVYISLSYDSISVPGSRRGFAAVLEGGGIQRICLSHIKAKFWQFPPLPNFPWEVCTFCAEIFVNTQVECDPPLLHNHGAGGTMTVQPFWYEPWVSGVAYAVGALVSHGGSMYECSVAHTSSAANEPGTGGGAGFWDGYSAPNLEAWVSGHSYAVGDLVCHDLWYQNDLSWKPTQFICGVAHTSSPANEPGGVGTWNPPWWFVSTCIYM